MVFLGNVVSGSHKWVDTWKFSLLQPVLVILICWLCAKIHISTTHLCEQIESLLQG